MKKIHVLFFLVVSVALSSIGQDINYYDPYSPAHEYHTRELNDPFTRLIEDFESGKRELDKSSGKAFVASLLEHLDVPASSQLLVFSRTSLQTRKISGSNPRALYFNEDVYVGYIPGGKVEIISLDPELGGIFYIFDIPKGGELPVIERSGRCMNCHAVVETRRVPGLSMRSVIPGSNWGKLVSYRDKEIGHQIPFSERFGGWHVTGDPGISDHKGNLKGEKVGGKIVTEVIEPGTEFDWSAYLTETSDILPHLLLEHQSGFMNLVLEASYRARTYQHIGKGETKPEYVAVLHGLAEELVRYLLFADEAKFPAGGIRVDAQYREDFLADRKEASNGISLKDLDLETRLFKHRCSYLIYSDVFEATSDLFRQQVYEVLGGAISTEKPDPGFAYLSDTEKKAIRSILRETLSDLPDGW
ncbi:MAG: hypothetical protein P1U87_23225 [Verrucomicrobiales bacterium]|nr:hypothetical protein [Verrucomicrobiales bacterium]